MFIIRKKRRTLKQRIKRLCLFIVVFIIICVGIVFIQFDKKVLPIAIEISHKYAITAVNDEINTAVNDIVEEISLTSGDFYVNTIGDTGKLNYLSVDTMLINKVCADIASDVSKRLNNMETEKINLPVGVFSGIRMLAHTGPKFSVHIKQMGETVVDYETSFESVGINQVNFQVWLIVETEVGIVNPLYQNNVKVTRKIMLVNTVFNGDVPNAYLDLNRK